MAEAPPEMMAIGRGEDQVFDDEELLYRRFSPHRLDGNEIGIAALELPDMSTIRQKYGRANWLLLDDHCHAWGVMAFHVRDIPPNRTVWQDGVLAFSLEPWHVPLKYNYPHSEVWVHRDGQHICKSARNLHLLDPAFHLRWRECLVLASHIVIQPSPSDEG